jgi:hypothetical protein
MFFRTTFDADTARRRVERRGVTRPDVRHVASGLGPRWKLRLK